MKKILRNGIRNLPSRWVCNCPNCGCQLEYDRSEIHHSGSEFKNMPPFVMCPECHQHLRHSESSKCHMNNIGTMQT